ncbi:MAG: excisionase family DNA-binding protein [Planctomycetota bacterium]|nr:excisionase family DNA-binding protein [Planctomycetota bacterium]
MASAFSDFSDSTVPTPADAALSKASGTQLHLYLESQKKPRTAAVHLVTDGKSEPIRLPLVAVELLSKILTSMGQGDAVTVVPINTELTTQQAADLLNVSRPYLIEQLEQGAIPFRKVGTHRRLYLGDVLAYKRDIYEKRRQALRELSALDQELGLGY